MLMELDDLITILDDAVDMQDNGKYQDALDNFYRDGILHDLKRYLSKQAKRIQELERSLEFYADEKNYEVWDEHADHNEDYIHRVDHDEGSIARRELRKKNG